MSHRIVWLSVIFSVVISRVTVGEMPWVQVADDKQGFVAADSGKLFVPWGFNYDHDETSRLLEDYWDTEWPTVEEDFQEMKQIGANVARIHLQTAKFMTGPETVNEANPERLGRLVACQTTDAHRVPSGGSDSRLNVSGPRRSSTRRSGRASISCCCGLSRSGMSGCWMI